LSYFDWLLLCAFIVMTALALIGYIAINNVYIFLRHAIFPITIAVYIFIVVLHFVGKTYGSDKTPPQQYNWR